VIGLLVGCTQPEYLYLESVDENEWGVKEIIKTSEVQTFCYSMGNKFACADGRENANPKETFVELRSGKGYRVKGSPKKFERMLRGYWF